MFTSGLLAQECDATVKALIAGIATEVNLEQGSFAQKSFVRGIGLY